jgi:hypothetical protein
MKRLVKSSGGWLDIFSAVEAWFNTVGHADCLLVGAPHMATRDYVGAYARLSNELFVTPMATGVVYVLSDAHGWDLRVWRHEVETLQIQWYNEKTKKEVDDKAERHDAVTNGGVD